MATLNDFENDKKEIISMIDSLHEICELDTNDNLESAIQFKLFNLHKKVKKTNTTIEKFLKDLSNIEKEPLEKMKDSLKDLIEKLERSVCVPEFCINSDTLSSCQYLTEQLIAHLQEITFCYDLTDMTRATNKCVRKTGKFRANSLYKSVAPSKSELIESAMKKKSIKCKRKQAKNTSIKLHTPKSIGRFSVTYPGESAADNGATDTSATVGKKKGRKGRGKGKKPQSKKKKHGKSEENTERKKKSQKSKKKSKN